MSLKLAKMKGEIMLSSQEIDYALLVDTAVLAGEIMLKNGAETNIVEEIIERILKTNKMKHIEAVVMTTSIIATMSDTEITPITVVRRIKERETNLSKVYLVNEVVEKFCKQEMTLEETFKELKSIKNHNTYKEWLINICIIFIPPLFVLMLNGKYLDTLTALICGFILVLTLKIGKKLKTNTFIINLFTTMIISMISVVSNKLIGTNVDLVIIGTIMPLVPGVAITNAAMDSLNGDYMSGIAKILEAVIKAVSIALGVGLGIGLLNLIEGGINL